jgi:hypothetical protein
VEQSSLLGPAWLIPVGLMQPGLVGLQTAFAVMEQPAPDGLQTPTGLHSFRKTAAPGCS